MSSAFVPWFLFILALFQCVPKDCVHPIDMTLFSFRIGIVRSRIHQGDLAGRGPPCSQSFMAASTIVTEMVKEIGKTLFLYDKNILYVSVYLFGVSGAVVAKHTWTRQLVLHF